MLSVYLLRGPGDHVHLFPSTGCRYLTYYGVVYLTSGSILRIVLVLDNLLRLYASVFVILDLPFSIRVSHHCHGIGMLSVYLLRGPINHIFQSNICICQYCFTYITAIINNIPLFIFNNRCFLTRR